MKKILSLIMTALLILSVAVMPASAETDKTLKFGEDGKPMLYVFKTCTDFIRTVPALTYDPRKVEDIDTAGEDHIYDETRYFLMSRPIAPRPEAKKKKEWVFNPLS